MIIWKTLALNLVIYCLFTPNTFSQEPYNVTVFGSFKRMVHTGDATGKIALTSVPLSAGTYGVGALAGLTGEILIWNGKILVTDGKSISGATRPPGMNDQATLLVFAQIDRRNETQVDRDMTQGEFEQFVINTAQSKGIDIDKPFPYIVMGEIADYGWHVITGKRQRHSSSTQHGQGHATSRTFSGKKAEGKLVGFYSAKEKEGVITHPGERFHVHYADKDLKTSGHLDHFGIAKGTILILPQL